MGQTDFFCDPFDTSAYTFRMHRLALITTREQIHADQDLLLRERVELSAGIFVQCDVARFFFLFFFDMLDNN